MRKGPSAKPARGVQFLFGSDFLHDHVGQIIDEPTVAILELVANSYDAGADRVEIVWPNLPGDTLSITDNGTGMTRKEFETRWRTLKYDRIAQQGMDVVFPSGVPTRRELRSDITAREDSVPFVSVMNTRLRLGKMDNARLLSFS
jgi:Histidine kinase-, DNA gyrase B-, and HSP90-like ATPase